MPKSGIVHLVDDDAALRRATERLLKARGFEVLAYASAEEFLERSSPHCRGCLLLDLRMPGLSGLELQRELARRGCTLPIVFLSGNADVASSVHAMKHGAVDFLEKPADEAALVEALDRALARGAEAARAGEELAGLRQRHAQLTQREQAVLLELLKGSRNKEIGDALGLAERTVKLHRARVLDKMGAASLAELVRLCERLGLRP